METAEFIKRTALFAGLTDEELSSVLSTAKQRAFPAGTTIIAEGHEGGRGFYVMLSGSAEVRKGSTTLATFRPGDYFGEMALLLEDTPRTASVVAIEDVTALVITQWDLRALLANHPDVGVRMMGELAKRLRDTDRALRD
jgi:CRP/FNR family cyclic AMP-dependent transcriptional regulator